jgi:REP element-mobilizing transposase RayT
MSNHIHFVTQLIPPFSIEDLNFKFRSFTGKELLKWIEIHKPEELKNYISMRIDRKFHIWKQKPLCVEIVSQKFMDQKTDYIHMNPVYAKLVEDPIYYTWSSAGYYETGNSGQFKFLEASDDF